MTNNDIDKIKQKIAKHQADHDHHHQSAKEADSKAIVAKHMDAKQHHANQMKKAKERLVKMQNESAVNESQSAAVKKALAKASASSEKGKDAVTLPKAPWDKKKSEGYVSHAQRKAVHAAKADGGKGHPDNKKEEVEQVDELDKKTLGSYIKKAGPDAVKQTAQAKRHSDAGDMADKDRDMYKAYGKSQRSMDKAKNRQAGIGKAVDKLTKEEVEQVDELSKKTLGAYAKAASNDHADHAQDMGKHYANNAGYKGAMSAWEREKRRKGVKMAINKLTKEDVKAKDEDLQGNQHKLDHNKDGKISGADFKGLRKKNAKAASNKTNQETGSVNVKMDNSKSNKSAPMETKESTVRERLMSIWEKAGDKHTKSGTPSEPHGQYDSPGGKQMKADMKAQGDHHVNDTEKLSHDDAAKAGRAGPTAAKRPNDGKLGDKAIINRVAAAYKEMNSGY